MDATKIPTGGAAPIERPSTAAQAPTGTPLDFPGVFAGYVSKMRTYRNFISLTLGVVPQISNALADRTLTRFAEKHGRKRSDLSDNSRTVYELDNRLREFSIENDEIRAGIEGATMLPEVMIIGLISAYDSFLWQLLRVVLNKHPSIVLTSEKSIRFSELSAFNTIEDARNAILDREIESILRQSHHQQFETMSDMFNVKLNENLRVWPRFVELCERRNLLTHTGGLVSHQYRNICTQHGMDTAKISIGEKLTVDPAYFSNAVHTVSEIGLKLCYVLWRKFAKDERDEADTAFNDQAFELIISREYKTAEALLSFSTGVLKRAGNDRTRRMMIVNLANAMKLQQNEDGCNKLLDSEDWSAVGDDFAMSLAAIRGNLGEVTRLMRKIGSKGEISLQDYRTWPVFRQIRTTPEFSGALIEIFGEPLVVPEAVSAAQNTSVSGSQSQKLH